MRSPNEDFGRSNQPFRIRVRSTFQRFVLQIRSPNRVLTPLKMTSKTHSERLVRPSKIEQDEVWRRGVAWSSICICSPTAESAAFFFITTTQKQKRYINAHCTSHIRVHLCEYVEPRRRVRANIVSSGRALRAPPRTPKIMVLLYRTYDKCV